MLLTSLERLKNSLGKTDGGSDSILSTALTIASGNVERYLRREGALEHKSYTQYFSPIAGQRSFSLPAYPVSSITSVYTDYTGKYTGSESVIDAVNYMLDADGKTLVFQFQPNCLNLYNWTPSGQKSLRIIYVAGLASDPVKSIWTSSTTAGMTPGKFIQGAISGAAAVIQAVGATSITYRSIFGVFQASETITEYTTLSNALQGGGFATATGQTATLTTCTAQSLAEAYPALVGAVEMECQYLFANWKNFSNIRVSIEGVEKTSRSDMRVEYKLTPEVREALDSFVDKRLRE